MKTYLAYEEQDRLLRKYGLRYDGQLGWESFPGLALHEIAVTLLERIERLENEIADMRRGNGVDLVGGKTADGAESGGFAGAAGKD